jgi:iron complex transport system ATP-binding protein
MRAPALEARSVRFGYSARRPVLSDLSLTVEEGDFVGIIGPNGAGKSTLLKILAGVRKPSSGAAFLFGQDIASLSPREIARTLALVPQSTESMFPFSVAEVVLMGRHPYGSLLAFEGEEDRRIAEDAMERTDVAAFADRAFNELSGGERQLVVLARALAQRPRVLLLDEPTSALDLKHQAQIYGILALLVRDGLTVVVVTHDLNLASRYCRRLDALSLGRIAASGTPSELLRETLVRELYGAEADILSDGEGRPIVLPRAIPMREREA